MATGSGPAATVLAFRPRQPTREALVRRALVDAAERRAGSADALYDLVNVSVYRLILAVTDDEATAERATVSTFVEIWRTAATMPTGAGVEWVLDVACRCARSTLAADRRSARRLRVVPGG